MTQTPAAQKAAAATKANWASAHKEAARVWTVRAELREEQERTLDAEQCRGMADAHRTLQKEGCDGTCNCHKTHKTTKGR